MKLYRVRVKEVWEQVYIVLAETPEEALKNGQNSGGISIKSEFEYDRTLVTDDIAMVEEMTNHHNHEQKYDLKGNFPVPQSLIEKANRHED